MAKTIEVIDHANVYTDPNGYYVVIDDVPLVPLCPSCAAEQAPNGIPEEWEPLGWGEVDSPTHCAECEALIVEHLTSDGVEYVLEALTLGDERAEVLEAWREAFASHIQ